MRGKPIFDWIQSSEASLILVTETLPVSNVMMAVLSMKAFEGQTTLLMASDPQSISMSVGVTLPENMFLPYTPNSALLQEACRVPCYIFIDNLTQFRLADLGRLLAGKSPKTKCVIFGTHGISQDDLDYFRKTFPRSDHVYLPLYDPGPCLDYQIYPCLTPTDKLLHAILYTSLNQNSKHLIFTQGDLTPIADLLTKLDIPHLKVQRGDSYETQKTNICLFNQSEQLSVFLTNMALVDELHNIAHVHFMEGVSHRMLTSLIHRIHFRRLYSLPIQSVSLCFHIAQKSDGTDGDDAAFYRRLSDQIRRETETFKMETETSKWLGCSSELGLSVNEVDSSKKKMSVFRKDE